ncbi:beta-lactamase family protein [bacterium]|nr:beta-lactamase family protein [bacterium]
MGLGITLIALCGLSTIGGSDPIFPAKEWPRSSPSEQGIDSARLTTMVESLIDKNPGIHSLMVVRHGHVVLDVTFYPFSVGSKHDIASCTKTVTAMTLGTVIDRGLLAGVDARLVDSFPRRTILQLDDRKRSIRLADVLTMRSGLGFYQQALSQLQMFQSPDWVQYCLNVKAARPPGEAFEYFNGNPHLLSAVITEATGKPADEVAKEGIFGPLGVDDLAWPRDPQGISWGWGDLRLTSEAMARLGLLVLHHGRWANKQILSEKWINEMTMPHVETTGNKRLPHYGYQIWLADDLIAFQGRGGQRIWIDRARDLIVVTTAGASRAQQKQIDDLWDKDIVPAVLETPRSESPDEQKKRGQAIQRAAQPPQKRPIAPMPVIAEQIDGVRYRMGANPYAEAIRLSFINSNEARIQLELPRIHRQGNLDLTIGLDGVPRLSPARYGEPAASVGQWNGNTFEIDFDEIGNINHWTIKLTFERDTVKLDMREGTELPPIRTTGKRETPVAP